MVMNEMVSIEIDVRHLRTIVSLLRDRRAGLKPGQEYNTLTRIIDTIEGVIVFKKIKGF